MGKILILAAYSVYAAFWVRFFLHALVWWRALHRLDAVVSAPQASRLKAYALTGLDVLFLGRLLKVNAALWLGEWVFHVTFFLVLARHLRYFLDPVPSWVWSVQTPGLVAGYILPLSLAYILLVRILGKRQKYASPGNFFLLTIVLMISSLGVLMNFYKPNLVDVKLFILGIIGFSPKPAPESVLFIIHFLLFLVLVPLLPTHIFTAPLVMLEAKKREQALHLIMHDANEAGR